MKLQVEAASQIGGCSEQDDRYILGRVPITDKQEQNTELFTTDTEKAPFLAAVLDGVNSCPHAALGAGLAAIRLQSSFYAEENWCTTPDDASQKLFNACMDAQDKLASFNRAFGALTAAATVSAAAFTENTMQLCAVGDSPMFLWRRGRLRQLFTPMNSAGEAGKSCRLLAFVGGASADFVRESVSLEKDDVIIIASDGVMAQRKLALALRFGMGAQAIAKLSTWKGKKYADNTTIIKIHVLEV